MKQSPSVIGCERGEIEEAGDVVHVEQVHLVGSPREAHRDDRDAREEWVALPRLERYGGQQIVLTENDIGLVDACGLDRVGDPDDARCIDTMLSEKLPEVVAEIAMASDTQCLQCAYSLDTGGSSLGAPSVVTATLEGDTTERRLGSSVVA